MESVSTMHKQSGAVSIFIVIFAILLMSIVTVGFLRIMINDQNKATGNDMAQSAYDSSLAGVEDAKRALLWYAQSCNGATPDSRCNAFADTLNGCNVSIGIAGVINNAKDIEGPVDSSGTGEVKIQQSTSVDADDNSTDKALDQAYTCVKMQVDTDDFLGSLTANQTVLIPLIATSQIDILTIEWFNREDVSSTNGVVDVPRGTGSTTTDDAQKLVNSWPPNRPPILRTQFMQVGSGFKLTDFDSKVDAPGGTQSNANTVFLYPFNSGNSLETMTDRDIRKNAAGDSIAADDDSAPLPARCQTTVSAGNYSCRISLRLPSPVNGGRSETAYLRLSALHSGGHYRVSIVGGAKFKGVQPIVDSTGRANNVFRRVQSRIDLYDTAFPYPEAAVDTTSHLCKDFKVTDVEYIQSDDTACRP